MTILKPRKVMDKWQFVLWSGKDYQRFERGWRVAEVGIFKLTSLPEEGVKVNKANFKGFLIRVAYWLPVETV